MKTFQYLPPKDIKVNFLNTIGYLFPLINIPKNKKTAPAGSFFMLYLEKTSIFLHI